MASLDGGVQATDAQAQTNRSTDDRECISKEEALTPREPGCAKSQCVMVQGICVPLAAAQELMVFDSNMTGKTSLTEPRMASDHTRQLLRALLAEAVGTGMIVFIGCGSVCSTFSGAYAGIWQVAVVWGLGVALAIYSTAEASGAHLNPAVTLAFQLVRPQAHGMTPLKSLLYIVSQMLGAGFGGLINLAVYSNTIEAFERANGIVRGQPESINSAKAFGEYFPNPGLSQEWGSGPYVQDDVSVLKALFVEAWGTCVLAFIIFGITHAKNHVLGDAARPAVPLMIGATVSVLLALYAPITQAGWNPARDFGPRLVAYFAGWGDVAIPGPRNGFWIYIVGPCLGAPVGAFFAENILWSNRPAPLCKPAAETLVTIVPPPRTAQACTV